LVIFHLDRFGKLYKICALIVININGSLKLLKREVEIAVVVVLILVWAKL